ncbi:MAG: hypothetical protein ACPLYW_01515, partial [Candidatus Nanoarchaeia archaeon]
LIMLSLPIGHILGMVCKEEIQAFKSKLGLNLPNKSALKASYANHASIALSILAAIIFILALKSEYFIDVGIALMAYGIVLGSLSSAKDLKSTTLVALKEITAFCLTLACYFILNYFVLKNIFL